MITKFKIFEDEYNYSSIDPFRIEYDIHKRIVNFIKKNNLKYIDNIKIYGHVNYIVLGKIGFFNDTLLKCKKLNADTPKDIMIGIPRFKGVDIYESILKQIIEKYKDKDTIELERYFIEKDAKKYNL